MIDILCIGDVVYDMIFPLEAYPVENSKSEIEFINESGGGPAANAAYLLSKWGTKCAIAGLIGDDNYGRKIASEYKSVNTDISLLELKPSYGTPLSVIFVNKQTGSRTVVNRQNRKIKYAIDIKALSEMNPKVILMDGHEPDASVKALEIFPDAKTVLDAGSLRDGTRILANKVDYLVSSERFALSYSGLPEITSTVNRQKCINIMRKLNSKQIVVTLGERGLFYNMDDEALSMPAFKAKAIDTTAAGDIFHGAFAYALMKNMPLKDILEFAAMAASISVRVQGGRQSIPALSNVMESLSKI